MFHEDTPLGVFFVFLFLLLGEFVQFRGFVREFPVGSQVAEISQSGNVFRENRFRFIVQLFVVLVAVDRLGNREDFSSLRDDNLSFDRLPLLLARVAASRSSFGFLLRGVHDEFEDLFL